MILFLRALLRNPNEIEDRICNAASEWWRPIDARICGWFLKWGEAICWAVMIIVICSAVAYFAAILLIGHAFVILGVCAIVAAVVDFFTKGMAR